MKKCILPLLLIYCSAAFSQGPDSIRVLFIYGSKPRPQFKGVEEKWFGGILGGHTGIESRPDLAFSFEPTGRQHLFPRKERESIFKRVDTATFWNTMGAPGDSVKKLTVVIPITPQQRIRLDSITAAYAAQTPYDYAVFSMRCAASTYEILAQLGLVKRYGHVRTFLKIFYPRRLRKRLLAKARKNGWTLIRQEGSERRKWEKDQKEKGKEKE